MRVFASVVVVLSLMGLMFCGCNPNDVGPAPEASSAAPAAAEPPAAVEAPAAEAPVADVAPIAEVPQETVEQMLARWKEMANSSSAEKPLVPETVQLASEIAARDPQALLSLLDLVEDPQSSPFVKILATLSLPPAINATVASRLIEMTKPEKESTIRACATNLLRFVPTDEVTEALRQLKSDTEPRVKFHAQLGLAQREPEARQEVYAMWTQPDLKPDQKGSIIDALSSSPTSSDLPLMLEVASSQSFEEGVRGMAIRALGSIGGTDQVQLLNDLATKDTSQTVREMAIASASQIQTRSEGKSQLVLQTQ